jgi:uncharacterized membrane protein YgdD (TMEM256/DUF423 family)
MFTARAIPKRARGALFALLALADVGLRIHAASTDIHAVLFGATSNPMTDAISLSAQTGVTVPLIVAPAILAPAAFLLGQVFVTRDARWVRIVSVAFFVGSFLVYAVAPALSVLLAVLAYLVLASGMVDESAGSRSRRSAAGRL